MHGCIYTFVLFFSAVSFPILCSFPPFEVVLGIHSYTLSSFFLRKTGHAYIIEDLPFNPRIQLTTAHFFSFFFDNIYRRLTYEFFTAFL